MAPAWQPHRTALFAAAALAALCFARDVGYALQTPGTDLQGALLGARLFVQGQDPYFTADGRPSYAVTISPLLLLAHVPLAFLPEAAARGLHLLGQWAGWLLAVALLAAGAPPRARSWTWGAGLALTAGHGFALHAERGQKFVALALLLSAAVALARRPARVGAAGALVGLAIAARPSALVALAAAWRDPRLLRAAALGGAVAIAATSLPQGPGIWWRYAQAMEAHARIHLGAEPVAWGLHPGEVPEAERQFKNLPVADSSLLELGRRLGVRIPPLAMAALALGCAGAAAAAGARATAGAMVLGVAGMAVADLFLPAPRFSYADVLWGVPLLGLLSAHGPAALRGLPGAAIAVGFVVTLVPGVHPAAPWFADVLPTLGLGIVAWRAARGPEQR